MLSKRIISVLIFISFFLYLLVSCSSTVPNDEKRTSRPDAGITIDNYGGFCKNGETTPCYSGKETTKNMGPCKSGIQTCNNGYWTACEGEVLPGVELCNQRDDDCNGQIDDKCTSYSVTLTQTFSSTFYPLTSISINQGNYMTVVSGESVIDRKHSTDPWRNTSIHIWDVSSKKLVALLGSNDIINTKSECLFRSHTCGGFQEYCYRGKCWEKNGEKGHFYSPEKAIISADGKWLATYTPVTTALWSLKGKREVKYFQTETPNQLSVQFTKDSRYLT